MGIWIFLAIVALLMFSGEKGGNQTPKIEKHDDDTFEVKTGVPSIDNKEVPVLGGTWGLWILCALGFFLMVVLAP